MQVMQLGKRGSCLSSVLARAGVQSYTVHAYDFAISDVPLTPKQYAGITRRAALGRASTLQCEHSLC